MPTMGKSKWEAIFFLTFYYKYDCQTKGTFLIYYSKKAPLLAIKQK